MAWHSAPKAPTSCPPPDLDPGQKVREQGWGRGGSATSRGLWPQSELFFLNPGEEGVSEEPSGRPVLPQEAPCGGWGHLGDGPGMGADRRRRKGPQLLHVERGPALATPFPRSRSWCKLTRRASVVTFQTSTSQAQAAEETSGQQERAQRSCQPPGAGQAHSRPPLLPRLIIPRAADHTPRAHLAPHQQTGHPARGQRRSLAVPPDPSETCQGGS